MTTTPTRRFLISLRVFGALLSIANVVISVYAVVVHYDDDHDSNNTNQSPHCVLETHRGVQPTCRLEGHFPKPKHQLSLATVFITSVWLSFIGVVLAWSFVRAPSNTQGVLGFSTSRLGRSSALILIGSFAAALGYDDRSEQDGLFVIGVMDLIFGGVGILSYMCISTADTGEPPEAIETTTETENPFMPLEEEQ